MNEYFLHVDLVVREQDHMKFEELVLAFMKRGGFGIIDPLSRKELVLALRSEAPQAYEEFWRYHHYGEQPPSAHRPALDRYYRYVHLWSIGDMKDLDLARLMTLCSDDDLYIQLDALVVHEIQNWVFRVPWLSQLNELEPAPDLRVARVTRTLSTSELGSYLFTLGSLVPLFESRGADSMGYFQNVTGALNTVTEFWQAPQFNDEKLDLITQSPAQLTAMVFGLSPELQTLMQAHAGRAATLKVETFSSYLPPELLNVQHVNHSWRYQRPEASAAE